MKSSASISLRTAVGLTQVQSSGPSLLPTSNDSGDDVGKRVVPEAARGPLVDFTLFQTLPAELRLKIWNYALAIPRIVEVRASETGEGAQHRALASLPAFALLHVCRESRKEAESNYHSENFHQFLFPGWLVNTLTDIFYLDFSMCVKLTDNNIPGWGPRHLFKHLALPSRLFDKHPIDYASTTILKFCNVEDIIVVMVEGPRDSGAAEIISLRRAAEVNSVAARLTDASEVSELEARLEAFKKSFKKIRSHKPVPSFRIMAMDRLNGTNLANSFICFRV